MCSSYSATRGKENRKYPHLKKNHPQAVGQSCLKQLWKHLVINQQANYRLNWSMTLFTPRLTDPILWPNKVQETTLNHVLYQDDIIFPVCSVHLHLCPTFLQMVGRKLEIPISEWFNLWIYELRFLASLGPWCMQRKKREIPTVPKKYCTMFLQYLSLVLYWLCGDVWALQTPLFKFPDDCRIHSEQTFQAEVQGQSYKLTHLRQSLS